MIGFLKRYWFLILMTFIIINVLGFYLFKNFPDFLDLIEHAESDEMIQNIKRKESRYEMAFSILFIVDLWAILFVPYLIIKVIKNKQLNLSKK
ncbi:hypothetical protein [Chryseobacterium wanjuense]